MPAPVGAARLHQNGRNGVLGRPVLLEQGGDQAYVVVGELAGVVLRAGLGWPGADLDGVAVDADRLARGGDAAFAVQEELQELDGLGEGAAGAAGGGRGGGVWGEADDGHQLLAGGEGRPGGELAVQSGADLDPDQEGARVRADGVGSGGEVGAQQVVFAVPVRAVRRAPVGGEGGEGVRACGVEFVLGGEVVLFGEPGADGGGRGSGEVTVGPVVVGCGGQAGTPGGVVLVPDHAQRVELGDPVGVEAAGFSGVAHGGDESAKPVAGVVGEDVEVAVLVAVGLGGGKAEAAGAGDGMGTGVEGDQVHRLGDAFGVDGEVEVPAPCDDVAGLAWGRLALSGRRSRTRWSWPAGAQVIAQTGS